MAITRFDPFREFMTVQERMNRLFGQAYLRDEELSRAAWVPPVDIYETEQHDLVIKAELPDMAREDIEVTVEHNTLTLKGTKLGYEFLGIQEGWKGMINGTAKPLTADDVRTMGVTRGHSRG